MTTDALLAYVHFTAIFATVALLAVELALCTPDAAPAQLHSLKAIDGFYGLSAMLALASGAARLVWGAKGSAYYLANPLFHTKIGLFVVVGLVSIYPTVQYFRWAKLIAQDGRSLPEVAAIGRVRGVLKLQLGLLFLIPLAAALMARAIGAR